MGLLYSSLPIFQSLDNWASYVCQIPKFNSRFSCLTIVSMCPFLFFRTVVKISACVLKKSTAPGVSRKVPTTWKCLSIIFGKLPTPICTAHSLSALETEAWEPPNCHWLLVFRRKIQVRNLFLCIYSVKYTKITKNIRLLIFTFFCVCDEALGKKSVQIFITRATLILKRPFFCHFQRHSCHLKNCGQVQTPRNWF